MLELKKARVYYYFNSLCSDKQVEPHLDHREKGGYNQAKTLFYPKNADSSSSSAVEVTMYVGQTSHRQYAGPGIKSFFITIFVISTILTM